MSVIASRRLWATAGGIALGIGFVGIVMPLLPTTPFLILAAYCFSRGSRRLHDWLLNHRTLGPPIRDWREHRSVSGKAKLSAMIAIALIFAFSVVLEAPAWALALQGAILGAVAVFLLTRPAPPAH
ncbi:MAG: YbaN family protein [Rhodospirillales bacterium]|nr:YbaN family protein [Rhodospirillales bacterium]